MSIASAPAIGDYERLFTRFQENDDLRSTAASVGLGAGSLFLFVCECGDFTCNERIMLALAEFDAYRSAHVAVVLPDHDEAMHRGLPQPAA